MPSEKPKDLDLVIQSQIDAWVTELEVLRRDPRVRKFAELWHKIEAEAAWYWAGPSGPGRIGGGQKRLGIPANELSGLKSDDLEDLVVRTRPAR